MERKMKASEWAKEDKIDHHLFLWYDNQQMTKADYEAIKKQVYRKKQYEVK